jgi:KUP system potassium uptake protein
MQAIDRRGPSASVPIALGIIGVSLFFGDTIITPAISVLGAMEGLELVAPALEPMVLPASIAILVGLFLVQQTGTARVGRLFGPVMVLWFATLAVLGARQIAETPAVLQALSPTYAIAFWISHGWLAFFALGTVVLAITGVEALYADMGHLGRRPITVAWLFLVFPALVINYFGQGALLLRSPASIENPFYLLAPDWGLIPLLILATAATIIASQAVISGAFSLTRQAVQLGLMPRLAIHHTSDEEIGQIYVPWTNWVLLALVIILVVSFRSSGSLAAAYSAAVTGTMVITTVLAFYVCHYIWGWSLGLSGVVTVLFLIIDLAFFTANLTKFFDGGWFPLTFAAFLYVLMQTWRRGRQVVGQRLAEQGMTVDAFLDRLKAQHRHRVAGTAVFLARDPERIPHALLHNLKHNKILHERVVFLTVQVVTVPWVPPANRCVVHPRGQGFYTVVLTFGYKENPDVPQGLQLCPCGELTFEPMETSFFLGRETLVPSQRKDLGMIEERLFIVLANNAASAADFFCLPPNRVVELGARIEV